MEASGFRVFNKFRVVLSFSFHLLISLFLVRKYDTFSFTFDSPPVDSGFNVITKSLEDRPSAGIHCKYFHCGQVSWGPYLQTESFTLTFTMSWEMGKGCSVCKLNETDEILWTGSERTPWNANFSADWWVFSGMRSISSRTILESSYSCRRMT